MLGQLIDLSGSYIQQGEFTGCTVRTVLIIVRKFMLHFGYFGIKAPLYPITWAPVSVIELDFASKWKLCVSLVCEE